jgi:hypothetical protein
MEFVEKEAVDLAMALDESLFRGRQIQVFVRQLCVCLQISNIVVVLQAVTDEACCHAISAAAYYGVPYLTNVTVQCYVFSWLT